MQDVIQDVYRFLADKTKTVSRDACDDFGSRMADMLHTRLNEGVRTPTLRMSLLGKEDTQIYYELRGAKGEDLQPNDHVKFIYGAMVEELVLTLVALAGHTVTDTQKEVELEGVKGHIDAIINDTLIDVKSASPFGYEKFAKGDLGSDTFGYVTQLSAYSQAGGYAKSGFLAVNKVTGELCYMDVPASKRVDAASRIRHIKTMLDSPEPPIKQCVIKREENGNESLGYPCNYCAYKHLCHPGLRVYNYSTGPKYYTKVVKEPRVQEIK